MLGIIYTFFRIGSLLFKYFWEHQFGLDPIKYLYLQIFYQFHNTSTLTFTELQALLTWCCRLWSAVRIVKVIALHVSKYINILRISVLNYVLTNHEVPATQHYTHCLRHGPTPKASSTSLWAFSSSLDH